MLLTRRFNFLVHVVNLLYYIAVDALLNKNLQYISTYNAALAKKLINAPLKPFELNINLAGETNILINGVPVHSVTGAQEEARAIFDSLKHDTKNVIHILYGAGLGYLADEFAQKAHGYVILFEPDIELLRFIFEAVDLTGMLKKENVFVVNDFEQLNFVYSKIFKYNFSLTINTLEFYKNFKEGEFQTFCTKALNLHNNFLGHHSYQYNKIEPFFFSMFESLPERHKFQRLDDLKNAFKNMPAIVVSAGPSLEKNIEILKKYKDNALIFAVGTAMRTLAKNGIVPDFMNYIERLYSSAQFDGMDLSKINLICEPYTSNFMKYLKFNKKFVTASYENNTSHLFAEFGGFETGDFQVRGTVSYHALSCAKLLGCSPIILLGQDLAFVDKKCYAQGSAYEDLECIKDEKTGKYKIFPKNREEFLNAYMNLIGKSREEKEKQLDEFLKKFNESILFVKDINGEILPTSADYYMFKSYFEDFAKNSKESMKLINSSCGAFIEGFEHLPLEEAMKNYAEQIIDKEAVLDKIEYRPALQPAVFKKNLALTADFLHTVLNKLTDYEKNMNSYSLEQLMNVFCDINSKRMKNTFFRLSTLKKYLSTAWAIREYENVVSKEDFLKERIREFITSSRRKAAFYKFRITKLKENI